MKKFLKWVLGITAVGAVVGLVTAYFCKDREYDECDEDEVGEDEDFVVDNDLKPPKGREYVPLKRNVEDSAKKQAEGPDGAKPEEKAEVTEESKPDEAKAE